MECKILLTFSKHRYIILENMKPIEENYPNILKSYI